MKILSAAQIKQWDQFTIEQEPITSINLMERAAATCVDWIVQHHSSAPSFEIYCSKGNNGGDGLAIARMLIEKKYKVSIHILEFGHLGSEDFQTNLTRLHQVTTTDIHFIQSEKHLHPISEGTIIIDAIFGSGLNRKIEGLALSMVNHINHSGCEIISIDLPSGLFVDNSTVGCISINATHTLSFQCFKKALLMAENAQSLGDVHILDIGLHDNFYQNINSNYHFLNIEIINSIYKPRKRFSHKGNFGHALLIAGSYGKIGAAVLSAKACMRSGVGLLTCHIPICGYAILQSTIPEAMVLTDPNPSFITKVEDDLTKYNCIGIGPGMGTAMETRAMLKELLTTYKKPVVMDADALNCFALEKELLQLIPDGSVLTPHPKEFERLFGETNNDFERIELALQKAAELNCIIVLKSHHTLIVTPGGIGYFNSTGNAGMATAGSGDVLTGIITGLLAMGYTSLNAAILGVYLHGLAGNFAASALSMEAMMAMDIISHLGESMLMINKGQDSKAGQAK